MTPRGSLRTAGGVAEAPRAGGLAEVLPLDDELAARAVARGLVAPMLAGPR